MQLTLDDNKAQYQIRAYQPGSIQVNQTHYHNSLIITQDQLITNWPPQDLAELQSEHFNIIREWKPALLLLGTGIRLQFPDLSLYGDLINQGIPVEIMDTRAACFTYIALTSENRSVAAALLIR